MKYTFAFLVSIFFFALTVFGASSEFTPWDLGFISGLILLVIAAECLVVLLLEKWSKLSDFVMSLFIIFNVIALHLALSSDFLSLPTWLMIMLGVVTAWIIFTLLQAQRDSPMFNLVVQGGLASAIFLLITFIVIDGMVKTPDTAIRKNAAKRFSEMPLEFKSKPNVYIFAFDSLIPKSLLKKHMKLRPTHYHKVLDKNFRPFRNFFSNARSSKPSLNSLLAYDKALYIEKRAEGSGHEFFLGLQASPLLEVFKSNGYETSTFYNTYYFGQKSGPFVDNYFVNEKFSACEFADGKLRNIVFFGFCLKASKRIVKSVMAIFGQSARPHALAHIFPEMQRGLTRDKPQFMVGYIYMPGHTPKGFNHRNKAQKEAYLKFYKRRSKRAGVYLSRLVRFLKREDPTAILYVFGDHGPWLSRSVGWKTNLEFYMQDRYGVFGGIYPKTFCPERLDSREVKYTTAISGIGEIVYCLAGIPESEKIVPHVQPITITDPNDPRKFPNVIYE